MATGGAHGAGLFRPPRLYRGAGCVGPARAGDQPPRKLVASYHGMPKRYLAEGDPYHCQCQKTSRLLRAALGWDEGVIDTTFQSVFGTEEWLRPIPSSMSPNWRGRASPKSR